MKELFSLAIILSLGVLYSMESRGEIPLQAFFLIVVSGGMTGGLYLHLKRKIQELEIRTTSTFLYIFFGSPSSFLLTLVAGAIITFYGGEEVYPLFMTMSSVVIGADILMLAQSLAFFLIPKIIKIIRAIKKLKKGA